jgi:type III restriction enzyme
VRPDFVFFTENPDGTIGASIVDPHGHHLGDALPKLRGLATTPNEHGHHYQRIDAVAKIDDTLRVLDLTEPSVRAAVADATDAATLYQERARHRLLTHHPLLQQTNRGRPLPPPQYRT